MPRLLETVGRLFGAEAAVRNVFGAPIRIGDRTILPVAKITYGFGGGEGPEPGESPGTSGVGAGGGAVVRPLGIYVIGSDGVSYRPVVQPAWLAGALAAGLVLGLLAGRRRAAAPPPRRQ